MMLSKKRSEKMNQLFKIFAILLFLVGNLIEVFFVWLLPRADNIATEVVLFVHLLAALVVASGFLFIRHPEDPDDDDSKTKGSSAFYPVLFIALFIPVFGPLTASIVGLFVKPFAERSSKLFEDYLEYVKTDEERRPRFDKLPEDRIIMNGLDIEPVVDLIRSESKKDVWGSIDSLSTRADRNAVELIRQTISQDDAEIKFLASIGLEKIEDQLASNLEEARQNYKNNKGSRECLALLQAASKYIDSGLVPENLSREIAAEMLEVIDDSAIKSSEINYYAALFLFSIDNVKESVVLVNKLVENQELSDFMYPTAMEIVMAFGDLDQVKVLMSEFVQKSESQEVIDELNLDINLDDLSDFWLSDRKEVPA